MGGGPGAIPMEKADSADPMPVKFQYIQDCFPKVEILLGFDIKKKNKNLHKALNLVLCCLTNSGVSLNCQSAPFAS